jgi:mono/diheme cytochrome c family protein
MRRMATWLVGVLFLMTAFLAADTALGDDISQGKQLFQEKCTICHGADGKGNGPAAAAFSKRPADFNKPEFWNGDVDKKISDTVRNGRPPMPAFSLSSDEIQAIIDYMKQSFKK